MQNDVNLQTSERFSQCTSYEWIDALTWKLSTAFVYLYLLAVYNICLADSVHVNNFARKGPASEPTAAQKKNSRLAGLYPHAHWPGFPRCERKSNFFLQLETIRRSRDFFSDRRKFLLKSATEF
jgi:hypothetical protein